MNSSRRPRNLHVMNTPKLQIAVLVIVILGIAAGIFLWPEPRGPHQPIEDFMRASERRRPFEPKTDWPVETVTCIATEDIDLRKRHIAEIDFSKMLGDSPAAIRSLRMPEDTA